MWLVRMSKSGSLGVWDDDGAVQDSNKGHMGLQYIPSVCTPKTNPRPRITWAACRGVRCMACRAPMSCLPCHDLSCMDPCTMSHPPTSKAARPRAVASSGDMPDISSEASARKLKRAFCGKATAALRVVCRRGFGGIAASRYHRNTETVDLHWIEYSGLGGARYWVCLRFCAVLYLLGFW